MAKISFPGLKKYGDALKQLEFAMDNDDLIKDAVWAGAQPVADEIRRRLRNLPEEKFQRLPKGKTATVVSAHQKEDLLDSLGVAPPKRNKAGSVDTKVGFDGYGSYPTKTYPRGVPNALIARSVESGSSVRRKTPFVGPAVKDTRKKAVEEMDKTINDGLKKIFKE